MRPSRMWWNADATKSDATFFMCVVLRGNQNLDVLVWTRRYALMYIFSIVLWNNETTWRCDLLFSSASCSTCIIIKRSATALKTTCRKTSWVEDTWRFEGIKCKRGIEKEKKWEKRRQGEDARRERRREDGKEVRKRREGEEDAFCLFKQWK